jgi:hypothetical protein
MGSVFSSGAVCAASLGKFASESIAAVLVNSAMGRLSGNATGMVVDGERHDDSGTLIELERLEWRSGIEATPLVIVGALVQQIGIALLVGGYAVWIGSALIRFIAIFRWREELARLLVIGFYARAVGTLGLVTLLAGGVIKGAIPWPALIVVFVIGAPALALMLVRPVRTDNPLGLEDKKKPS